MTPTVLVFSGLDPSGGAGMAADVLAIAAQGAHALPVVTALTAQDQNRVHAVEPVQASLLEQQARLLVDAARIDAVKIGIPGSRVIADQVADIIARLRLRQPRLPVVLDPVLASGHGDALTRGNAVQALARLLPLATVVTPNTLELAALRAQGLLGAGGSGPEVLVTGGHEDGEQVVNRWRDQSWRWPRLSGSFHGSGCTLASALAARLALGESLAVALEVAQTYTHRTLEAAFAIGAGQAIPRRVLDAFQPAPSDAGKEHA
jgi:hydroxymethylpyrimidine/phosphomethylpyrimidine kinase